MHNSPPPIYAILQKVRYTVIASIGKSRVINHYHMFFFVLFLLFDYHVLYKIFLSKEKKASLWVHQTVPSETDLTAELFYTQTILKSWEGSISFYLFFQARHPLKNIS